MNFIWHAIVMLSVGFVLIRILGKKTVGEMTGLEIITLLAMASMIGHAMPDHGVMKTIIILCIFVSLLILVQFLSLKYDTLEKWIMGKASLVIRNGTVQHKNLKKLRLTVDQLEAKLREKGITSFADVKTATIEISGELGYELTKQAKPVTVGELEQILYPFQKQLAEQNLLLQELKMMHPSSFINPQPQQQQVPEPNKPIISPNLFDEVVYKQHELPVEERWD
ncbi:DUF421 domain-containing protein [Ammoniphilus resinae]|uniref:Uncharacterized membrane protein YcaP (DUF421 family) n=1 Tax=Ammoniphilus resinae TaxID=861532 RepID=A0ABS4GQ06_9BACL|nr:YetF domain-containing protein [Ammoniphilus resinae]MBP1932137.1 uncharacterized membrane protein YcaP (DUF421 family) [Ammoniphilus resinae]